MTGKYNGVTTKVKSVAPDCAFTHCVIHREALVSKKIPSDLKEVLDDAVKIINFIKSRSLNCRLFKELCIEMESEYTNLLMNTEVRWLSRGRMLTRLLELRTEVQIFLQQMNNDFYNKFLDEIWLAKLAYLSDIFSRLNELNLSLQGSSKTPFEVHGKIKAMIKKLNLIVNAVENNSYESFAKLEQFLFENKFEPTIELKTCIISHCKMLIITFSNYFPESHEDHLWIQNPFLEQQRSKLCFKDKESLIDISCNPTQKIAFQNTNLFSFWMKQKTEYESLYREAVKYLLPFTSTYLCEQGFSSMVIIKNKYRTTMNLEPNMRLKLTKIEPDIKSLISKMQCQRSH